MYLQEKNQKQLLIQLILKQIQDDLMQKIQQNKRNIIYAIGFSDYMKGKRNKENLKLMKKLFVEANNKLKIFRLPKSFLDIKHIALKQMLEEFYMRPKQIMDHIDNKNLQQMNQLQIVKDFNLIVDNFYETQIPQTVKEHMDLEYKKNYEDFKVMVENKTLPLKQQKLMEEILENPSDENMHKLFKQIYDQLNKNQQMQQPQIRYTLIGFNETILVDQYEEYGDFVDYTQDMIFPKIKKTGHYMWTSYNKNYMYIKQDDQAVFLAMFDKEFTKDMALKYLEQVKEEFLKIYDINQCAKATKMEFIEFRKIIQKITQDFNNNYSDKSKEALNEVLQFKSVLVESLDKILQRDSQLEEIKDRMSEMNDRQKGLMEDSLRLRRTTQRQQMYLMGGLTAAVLFLLYIIIALKCGFALNHC